MTDEGPQQRTLRLQVDSLARVMGYTFRWSDYDDSPLPICGKTLFLEKVIWVRFCSGPRPLAHEFAHLSQYEQRGRSECRPRKDAKLAAEHATLSRFWEARLLRYGIVDTWREALAEARQVDLTIETELRYLMGV